VLSRYCQTGHEYAAADSRPGENGRVSIWLVVASIRAVAVARSTDPFPRATTEHADVDHHRFPREPGRSKSRNRAESPWSSIGPHQCFPVSLSALPRAIF
jgi:hypothetical protein